MSNYIRDVQYLNAGKAKKEIDNMVASHCNNGKSVKSFLNSLNDGHIIDKESARILNSVYDICMAFENDTSNEYFCEINNFDNLFSLFNLRKHDIAKKLSGNENIIDVEASTISSEINIDNLKNTDEVAKDFAVDKASHNDVTKHKKHRNIKVGKPSRSLIKSLIWLVLTIVVSIALLASEADSMGVDVSIENDFDRAKIAERLEDYEDRINKLVESREKVRQERRERNRSHE